MKTVYLAGPITGCDFNTCTDWRREVRAALAPEIEAFDPMRGKEYLAQEACIRDSYPSQVMSSEKGLFHRDLHDVMSCDLLLINFIGATTKSLGTIAEMSWAYLLRKPIVVAIEDNLDLQKLNPHEHAFMRQMCPFRLNNMIDAVEVTRSILLSS